MNTMKWLVRREFWEHKGGFFWAPAVVGAIMVVLLAVSLLGAVAFGTKHGIHINGAVVNDLSGALDAQEKADLALGLATGYMGMAGPLILVMTIVVFFFCLGSLFDERKDKSVLFWKSLPVSDAETVLAKVATALVMAPLIMVVLATITAGLSLIIVLLGGLYAGVNVIGPVLSSSGFWLAPFQLLAMLPVYVLWALPTVGWLMMVSAWARTKPFLWAVGVPVLAGTLLTWFNALFDTEWNVEWFWQHIVGRGLLSVAPGTWFGFTDIGDNFGNGDAPVGIGELMTRSYHVFATPSLWIGVVVGAAMIFAAIRLRRWRDEG